MFHLKKKVILRKGDQISDSQLINLKELSSIKKLNILEHLEVLSNIIRREVNLLGFRWKS